MYYKVKLFVLFVLHKIVMCLSQNLIRESKFRKKYLNNSYRAMLILSQIFYRTRNIVLKMKNLLQFYA